MSTKLIETTSPLYFRRLARELNQQFDGFYQFGARFSGARFAGGKLRIRFAGGGWTVAANGPFSDPYGQEVVASRKP